MKKLCYLLVPLLLISLFGCKKEEGGSYFVDATVSILLMDDQQNNLLENGTINENRIKIFYMVDGVKKLYMEPFSDHSKGYTIEKNKKGEKILRVHCKSDSKTSITIIEYENNKTDTIRCDFERFDNLICTKIWCNNQLKWAFRDNQFPDVKTFSIIK